FWMDWRLALIAVAIVPLFALSTRRLGKRIRKVARTQRERKGEMGATATEAIGSIKTVQALSLESVHAETFTARNKSDLKEGVKAKRLSARLISTTDLLIAIGTAGVLYFGGRMVMRAELSAGDLIVFLSYLKAALRPIRNVAKYSGRLAKASASAERIIEVLDTTPAIVDRPDAVPAPEDIHTVAFEEVTFGYRDDRVVIDAFSLTAARGEVVVLAGPSGAGKSTILNLLLRLYDPGAGRVVINGRDAREFTIDSLRRQIAVVPQENVLFAVSIRDNIAYGAPGATDEDVVAAARLAQAHDFISAMPEGYDTVVGERGGTLSEGQRQRVAIARAAIRRAPILVLDEPTASLDNENNRLVRDALRALSADRITFIIAHDLSTVARDNRVLYLDQGRVVEEGTHEALIRQGGRYAALCMLQRPEEVGPGADHPHAVGS
ncbi:MAG: ABC transporter ATP-binding protein/permease, partial [Phycisphaerae bacterium]|nr:ABC transporter ATP-binding protein/permease [Phycisphaerae bacterium]